MYTAASCRRPSSARTCAACGRNAARRRARWPARSASRPSYVNLLENNERSVSVPVLLRLFEVYGIDWRDIAEEDGSSQLADLRAIMQDPIFDRARPDLTAAARGAGP